MQLSTLFLTAVAATLASAVQLTNSAFPVAAGQPFQITWSNAQGPVTLTLKNGPSTALTTVGVIGTGLSGTAFEWTPPANLNDGLYAIEITDSTNVPNYSVQFPVSGANAAASTVTATSTGASTSGASSTVSGTATDSSTTGSETASSSTTSATASTAETSTTTTSSASSTFTSSGNTTLTAHTTASRTGSSHTNSTKTSGSPTSTNAPTSAGAEVASPLAFVFLALAAIITLN